MIGVLQRLASGSVLRVFGAAPIESLRCWFDRINPELVHHSQTEASDSVYYHSAYPDKPHVPRQDSRNFEISELESAS